MKPAWLVLNCKFLFYFCRGPSEENVPPHEACERLQLFQAKFDELWTKYISLSGGEELFGLPITGTFSENRHLVHRLFLYKHVFCLGPV